MRKILIPLPNAFEPSTNYQKIKLTIPCVSANIILVKTSLNFIKKRSFPYD